MESAATNLIDVRAATGWPALMSRSTLARYLDMSEDAVRRICPIPPLDLGLRQNRWPKQEVDRWLASLPARLPAGRMIACRRVEPDEVGAEQRRAGALTRAAERTSRRRQQGRRP